MNANTTSTKAIVIGGSMAGLLAARVLSDHFDQVTVIERDALPQEADFRSGTPQARHGHLLLVQGLRIMERFFPGLENELVSAGAPRMQLGIDTTSMMTGGWLKRFDSGMATMGASRILLEWAVRRRVQAIENITFLSEREVTEPIFDDAGQKVVGVEVEQRKSKTREILYADLVIDASGRTSKAPEWLEAHGFKAPEESTVDSRLGYATRWYAMPQNAGIDWKLLVIQADPDHGLFRGGGIFQVEDNQWVVTLAGANEDYPPTDEQGFLDFAKSLNSPALYEAIKDATPTSRIFGYRRTANRLRHFERLTKRPENLIFIGDSVCAFNPVYGQGMTVAALEAEALATTLDEFAGRELTGMAAKFQTRLAKVVKTTWLMATGEDLRYPLTTGAKPGMVDRMVQQYMNLMFGAMVEDTVVTKAFMEVMNLVSGPEALFRPEVVLRVMRHHLTGGKRVSMVNAPGMGQMQVVKG